MGDPDGGRPRPPDVPLPGRAQVQSHVPDARSEDRELHGIEQHAKGLIIHNFCLFAKVWGQYQTQSDRLVLNTNQYVHATTIYWSVI